MDAVRDGLGDEHRAVGRVGDGPDLVPLEIREQEQELVSSLARDEVGLPGRLPESVGELAKELVPRLVAEGVVHELEVVEVGVDDGDRELVTACPRHREVEEFFEHRPVGQAGELVVVGEEGDLLLGLLALGDVEHHPVDEGGPAVCVSDHDGGVPEPHDVTRVRHEPVLEGEGGPGVSAPQVLPERAFLVLGVQVLVPAVRVRDVVLGGDPEEPRDLGRDVGGGHRLVHNIDVDDRGDLLHERAVAHVRLALRRRRLVALQRLSDERADALQELDEVLLRRLVLAAQELQDARDLVAAADRESDGADEPADHRRGSLCIVEVEAPLCGALRPDAPGKPDARGEPDSRERSGIVARDERGVPPRPDAAERFVRTVDDPQRPDVPSQLEAEDLEEGRGGRREVAPFRENPAHGTEHREPVTGPSVFGAI